MNYSVSNQSNRDIPRCNRLHYFLPSHLVYARKRLIFILTIARYLLFIVILKPFYLVGLRWVFVKVYPSVLSSDGVFVKIDFFLT